MSPVCSYPCRRCSSIDPLAVGQLPIVAHGLDLHGLLRCRLAIRRNRVRRFRDALEERLVRLVRHDGGAFVDGGADAAEMIPVMVRGHDVANRLVRDQLLRFCEHRLTARLRCSACRRRRCGRPSRSRSCDACRPSGSRRPRPASATRRESAAAGTRGRSAARRCSRPDSP